MNKRQEIILNFIETSGQAQISDILEYLLTSFEKTSKITIIRDLNELIKQNLIIKKGKGRSITYELSPIYKTVKPINIEEYFKIESDKRKIFENFNFDIFSYLKNIFTEEEKRKLNELNEFYLKNLKNLPKSLLKREFERLTIEFSWKSSFIEGNTYTLLETEYLLREHKEPKGHTKEEKIMILNHKLALDFIQKNKSIFKKITIPKIEIIHSILTKGINVSKNIRNIIVRIIGTRYKPIENRFQIKEALEEMCRIINQEKNAFSKALIAILLLAYIQPFEDGNKRTSRLIGNAILMTNNICPLSYRSIDELEYKKAIILFYEQNNLSYLKQLFIDQFKFAVENYFGA